MNGLVKYEEKNINLLHVINIGKNIPTDTMKPCVYFETLNNNIKYWFFRTEDERDKAFNLLLEHMTNIEL